MFIVKAPERVQKWSCEELFLDRCQSCGVVPHHLLMLVALWSDLTCSERTAQAEDGISSCQRHPAVAAAVSAAGHPHPLCFLS